MRAPPPIPSGPSYTASSTSVRIRRSSEWSSTAWPRRITTASCVRLPKTLGSFPSAISRRRSSLKCHRATLGSHFASCRSWMRSPKMWQRSSRSTSMWIACLRLVCALALPSLRRRPCLRPPLGVRSPLPVTKHSTSSTRRISVHSLHRAKCPSSLRSRMSHFPSATSSTCLVAIRSSTSASWLLPSAHVALSLPMPLLAGVS